MKKTRRFAAFVASVLAVAYMAAPMAGSFSAEAATAGSITLTGATVGTHTYTAYKIFNGTVTVEGTVSTLEGISWAMTDHEAFLTALKAEKAFYNTKVQATDPDTGELVVDGEGNPVYEQVDDGTGTMIDKTVSDFANETTAAGVAKVLAGYESDSKLAKAFAEFVAKYAKANSWTGTDSENGVISLPVDPDPNEDGKDANDGYYVIVETGFTGEGADADNGKTGAGAITAYLLTQYDASAGADITVKSGAPEVIKKVKENAEDVTATGEAFNGKTGADDDSYDVGEDYNDVADYCIGDSVPFKLYGTVPAQLDEYDHYYYKFVDTLGKEFDIDETTITICVNGTTEVAENLFNIHKDVTVGAENTKIEITFEDIKALKDTSGNAIELAVGDVITVEYKATLTDDAVIGLDGQINSVYLEYSNNPNVEYNPSTDKATDKDDKTKNDETDEDKEAWDEDDTKPESPDDLDNDGTNESDNTSETPVDTVIVFTYELDVTKQDAATKAALANAKFVLSRDNDGTTEYAVLDSAYKITGWTTDEHDATPGEGVTPATVLTSGADGTFKVIGLDQGEYSLTEIEQPSGYNLLEDSIDIEITADTENNQIWDDFVASKALKALTISVGDTASATTTGTGDVETGIVNATVYNNSGSTLPSTGGMGTTLFYVGGGALALGAGVLLVSKKRMANK